MLSLELEIQIAGFAGLTSIAELAVVVAVVAEKGYNAVECPSPVFVSD